MGDGKGSKEGEALKLGAAVLAHAGLIVLGARTQVDVPPQVLTLQSFFVVYAGFRLGAAHAAIAAAVYLLLGCCGLPVFAGGGSGLAALGGRSGGYLWGFVLAAAVAGRGVKESRWTVLLLYACLAHFLLLLAGALQLALVSNVSFAAALSDGIEAYAWGAFGKSVAVAWLARSVARGG